MNWYLVHTKPRQERSALENLQWQGYECYFPTMPAEKIRCGKMGVVDQALFPRYLFIRLGQGPTAQGWAPIRSTKGVSRLVTFGAIPAKVDDALITLLRSQEALVQAEPDRLFRPGERVRITTAPFVDIEGIYQMTDPDQRVMVLIELMSKPVKIHLAPTAIRKVG
jgi:transcriptional antiterminator RfaH